MTQLSSYGPTRQFGEPVTSGAATAADWVSSEMRRPDVLVVLAVCAIGLIVTLVAASTLPGFTTSLSEAYMVVGP